MAWNLNGGNSKLESGLQFKKTWVPAKRKKSIDSGKWFFNGWSLQVYCVVNQYGVFFWVIISTQQYFSRKIDNRNEEERDKKINITFQVVQRTIFGSTSWLESWISNVSFDSWSETKERDGFHMLWNNKFNFENSNYFNITKITVTYNFWKPS